MTNQDVINQGTLHCEHVGQWCVYGDTCDKIECNIGKELTEMGKVSDMQVEILEQLKKYPQASNEAEAAYDLIEAVGTSEDDAALVLEDFSAGMTIKDAEKAVHDWCDANRDKSKRVAGCPNHIARQEIRKAFGLPEQTYTLPGGGQTEQQESAPPPQSTGASLDLLDFL